jgi:hypothetical protein
MLYRSFSPVPARPAGWFRMGLGNLSTLGVKFAFATGFSPLLQDLREVSIEHGTTPVQARLPNRISAQLAQVIR